MLVYLFNQKLSFSLNLRLSCKAYITANRYIDPEILLSYSLCSNHQVSALQIKAYTFITQT